ncbi:NADH-quinone oxidoreductase subunit NuoF [Dehalobacter sp. DCM]|nr:NADH-quinone oxidoreductase subunit NuoF [Dehalobacter sp. DCM]
MACRQKRKQLISVILEPDKSNKQILVCNGTGCYSSGSQTLIDLLKEGLAERNITDVDVRSTGCHGFCEQGPTVIIDPGNTFYTKVKSEDIPEIIAKDIVGDEKIQRLLYQDPTSGEYADNFQTVNLFAKQQRVILDNCGKIDPEQISHYLAKDGYQGLEKAVKRMSPDDVVAEVKKSGLRGRGGAGFPTGLKWSLCRQSEGNKKYVICNADEGDPGAFMDRGVLEGDPHAVIEGMLIGAYAIGADEGYIYCRAEYPLAIDRLKTAIAQAEKIGILGNNILNSGFNFKLHIKEGAGAFVCGEETALIASIEGKRGMPTVRPPYPAVKGLWGKPTNINNVETWANVPYILRNGADWYTQFGTEKSKGTKIFALTGKVNNTGLVEVPMGMTLREIIFDIGGGIKDGNTFKAVQIGGPSGGCLPEGMLDLEVDYDNLTAAGAMVGSGGMVILDNTTCMVDIARFFLSFTQKESCGKCTPCREGTKRLLEILVRITKGDGKIEDLETLERLAKVIKRTSLCGLGQTAPNPLLATLKYFRHEYEAHILEKRCPAHACTALMEYTIDSEKCKRCGKCAKVCPVGCISGDKNTPYVINTQLCIKCGACKENCKFDAISQL